jgi:hypothetical protein
MHGISGYFSLAYLLNCSANSLVPLVIESASILQAKIKGLAVIRGNYLTIASSSGVKDSDLTGFPLSKD